MRTINLFSKTVLASSLLMVSAVSLAHNGEDHSAPEKMTVATSSSQNQPMQMDRSQMNHSQMNQAQHQATSTVNHLHHVPDANTQQSSHYDHRSEHGAQIYAITTVDNKWFVNEDGTGGLKSEFETRIGTDENKVFIKVHADKEESHDAHYDAKLFSVHDKNR